MQNHFPSYASLAQSRRSIRGFLPTPVPQALLEQLLQTARQAPSGANLQPGRFWALQGEARERVSVALCEAVRTQQPPREEYDYFPQPMPMQLRKRQVAAAQALYRSLGIARGDAAARAQQFEHNYRFFDAPVALLVTIERAFGSGGFMDLGMCLHGLLMAAHAEGLGACAIGALASYPEIVRRELGLPDSEIVVCGVALGWPDPEAPGNQTRTEREPLAQYFQVLS
ncbi:nitroreductase [Comamonas endophytica]|uniref:Nitroreductase n=1 Tax=Comamonas endophytica TaxID=2949090 RepID=A0ABY6G6Y9_9BURK|nr:MULTISPECIES: nitroreductase [unclassified Acidovorax]MCD2511397.1 nitroreductase [Acidovorax sp. D4N7]UYG50789.1 nitroreductase [Acidovorax sp. 5MLIR]